MLTKSQHKKALKRTLGYFKKAGIAVTDEEKSKIEILDFDLGDFENVGLEILVYVNTARVCAKELILFPRQTCVEHLHPTIKKVSGKEETFRCRWGKVFLYVPGRATAKIKARKHESIKDHLTVFHEIVLNPGEQYTLSPDTLHWFQGGPKGAVVSEFSTTSTDEQDRFTDPRVIRVAK
jgi:D-lyxose ketol-isomerase